MALATAARAVDEAAAGVAPGAASALAAIELDGLSVAYGRREVLSDLRADLHGRSIGLLGPNGAGKTTLLHALLGFVAPKRGTARVLGNDIRGPGGRGNSEVRRQIGYMPERDAFIAHMSAVRFVRLMAELSGLPPREALERAHEVLFYVGLGEARYRPLGTYSLGMKQLAKLAQALVHGPRLIFLDEPTNGLDPPARLRMLQLIREVRDRGEATIVVSSHLLRDVEECCEEVLVLKAGRIATYCNLEAERRSNKKFLLLETVGNQADFVSALQRMGCEVGLQNRRRLRAVLPERVEVSHLFRLADELGVQLRRLDDKRDSLEDIFLRAMEDEPERAGAGAG